jgi:6,7-dimethyl-8-ribityllumazine synthase
MAFVVQPGALLLRAPLRGHLAQSHCPALTGGTISRREGGGARRGTGRARVAHTAPPVCAAKDVTFSDSLNGDKFRIGIVWTRWNGDLVTPLVEDVKTGLRQAQVASENIPEMQVPGAFEIPMAARLMCATQKVDAVVCVGVLIKGETDHYEYIAGPVASGLMELQLTTNIPIVFGVLTCRDRAQAVARSTGDKSHAQDWARTAIEMALLRSSQVSAVFAGKKSVGF